MAGREKDYEKVAVLVKGDESVLGTLLVFDGTQGEEKVA